MEQFTEALLDLMTTGQSPAGFGVLFMSALLEYVFPPFPGDTVTLFGAFLAATGNWSVPLVFVVVTAGSVAGAAVDYAFGRRLVAKPIEELSSRGRKAREKVRPIIERFERHGAVYVAINRFLPGIRALFFVAAGMARLPLSKVILWGGLSAAVWNGMIIAVGFAVGKNWERLLEMLKAYSIVAWILVGVVVVIFVVKWLVKR